MPLFGGANKSIIGKIHHPQQITEILRDTIGKAARVCASFICGFLYFLTMFICTGQKHHIKAIQPFESSQKVAGQRGIGMADMRLVIHIVNRGGKIIGLFHGHVLNFKLQSNS
jgi:hypothetical protein